MVVLALAVKIVDMSNTVHGIGETYWGQWITTDFKAQKEKVNSFSFWVVLSIGGMIKEISKFMHMQTEGCFYDCSCTNERNIRQTWDVLEVNDRN